MKLNRQTALAAAMIAAVVLWTASPAGVAWAEDQSVVETLEEAETAAVGEPTPADAESPVLRVDGDAAVVELNASDLEVALGSSADVAVSESGQYAVVEDSSITYAVSYPEDGATRFSAILSTPIDDHPRWIFESGIQLLVLEDGSVSISDGEKFLGGIEAPWAIDAEGRSLPTHYEVAGTALQQIVDTEGAAFPVVADPTVQFYGPYIQVHLNRAESITAVSGYAACAAVLSKSPVWFAKALQVACATVAAFSGTHLAGGKCVSIHYVVGIGGSAGVWWPWFRKC